MESLSQNSAMVGQLCYKQVQKVRGQGEMPFIESSRAKQWLFPPTLDEMVAGDHEVRFVAEFVERLDLRKLGIDPDPAPEGRPSYSPRVLLACWTYGFMVRVRSTRKLEEACRERLSFMWLTGMTHPDHNTLWSFYKENREGVRRVFKETVAVAHRLELTSLVEHALDGTKVQASASKERSLGKEALEKLGQRVDEQIEELERQNKDEEAEGGGNRQLPGALRRAEDLKKKIEEALQEVEKNGGGEVNLTDSDAKFMKGRRGIEVSYNGQVVVERKGGIIVGADVVNEANDKGQLGPMLGQVKENVGTNAEETVADAGYYSGANIAQCRREGIDVVIPDQQASSQRGPVEWAYHRSHFDYEAEGDIYRCPQGQVLSFTHLKSRGGREIRVYRGQGCETCGMRGECTRDPRGRTVEREPFAEEVAMHAEKMKGEAAQSLSRRRKEIVEPVIGILKEQLGGGRFLLRGLKNVKAEWALLCAAHNLWKIFRQWWAPAARGGCLWWGRDMAFSRAN